VRADDKPARRNARRGKGKAKGAMRFFGVTLGFGAALGRPAKIFLAVAAIAAIGVPINALYLQDGRHPAPLFGAATSQGSGAKRVATVLPPAEAPLPPQRPAAAPAPQAAAAKPAAKAPGAKSEPARAEKSGDAIAALLSTNAGASAAPAAPAHVQPAEKTDKNVLLAQRALAKLGYGVRADGVYGGATREALEKFERSIGAPAKGDLTPKLLRQLATRSGVAPQ
jgi:hypothetical protein